MAFFSLDPDGRVEWFFRKTLFLWLFPYIIWYLGREAYTFALDWVTEPADLESDAGG